MSLQIKGSPRPLVTLLVIAVIALAIWLSIASIGYFWVMIVPNIFLVMITLALLMAYAERQAPAYAGPEKFPSLSVLIPSYNSRSTILGTIASVRASDYPGEMEIIVVDDGSSDGSREMLKSAAGIRLILLEKNGGKARALNHAIRDSKGEVIACIDSDSYPQPDALRHAVATLLRDPRNGASTCFIRVNRPRKLIEKLQDIEYLTGFGFTQLTTSSIEAIYVTPGPTTLFTRKAIEDIGGFDEENITEDLEIAWRLRKHGYRIDYSPDAVVFTDVPTTLAGLFRQRMRWCRGKFFNIRKHGDMIFNRKYGLFGMFILPFSFSADLAGIVLSFSFVYMVSRQAFWFLQFVRSTVALQGSLLDLSSMLALGTSAMAVGLILVSPWFLVIYLSHVIARKSFSARDLPVMAVFFFVYGVVISFFYCIAVLQEINRSDYRWK